MGESRERGLWVAGTLLLLVMNTQKGRKAEGCAYIQYMTCKIPLNNDNVVLEAFVRDGVQMTRCHILLTA